MKKILVLYQDWGNWFLDDYSTVEHWFKNFDRAYDEKNEYYFLTFSNQSKIFKAEKNITVQLIKSSPIKQFKDLFKLKNLIKEKEKDFKPDYIYSSFIYMLSAVPKNTNAKVVGFLRDKTSEMVKGKGGYRKFAGNIFYILDIIAFKKINLILHNGKSMQKYAKDLGYKNKIKYCPRPISDLEYFSKANKDEVIKKYNLKSKKTILSVARLTPEKNLELGIKALKYLPENYVYIIIGRGEHEATLLELAKKEEVLDRVIFEGFVLHKDIWKYYKAADVFWLLSKSDFEGTPNVLQEVLYAKLPCIVSTISAMKNIITNNKTGLILSKLDEKELASKTKHLLNDKNKINLIKKEGTKKINQIQKQSFPVNEVFK